MRFSLHFAVLVFAASLCAADSTSVKTHFDYRREYTAAFARNDLAAARSACEAALRLRPDSPRYLHNLALIAARSGQPADALDALRRLAGLGIYLPIEKEEGFASLHGKGEFDAVLHALARYRAPQGHAAELFALPGMTGIVEGIAWRQRTGDFFFGDVHHRCVWRRDAAGLLSRFSPTGDVLFGVFQIALDEPRGLLWAATAMRPETSGYTNDQKGRAALVALDLVTGKVVRTFPLSADHRDHVLGDLLLAPDGTVYATDSTSPVIWFLPPDSAQLQVFAESPAFVSLQGLAMVGGGRKLLVADYPNGLVTVDLATRAIQPLAPPTDTTLLGLDGLLVYGDKIIAVQNGVTPQRVVRIALTPDATHVTAFAVLAAALPHFDDLTLINRGPDGPIVVAASGWSAFENPKSPPTVPHTTRLFRLAPQLR